MIKVLLLKYQQALNRVLYIDYAQLYSFFTKLRTLFLAEFIENIFIIIIHVRIKKIYIVLLP